MTLSQELRQSVISRVEQGIQYRDISRELNISVGSIVNIIKNHKTGNGHEQPIEVKTLQAQNHVVYEPNQELQDIDFADNLIQNLTFTRTQTPTTMKGMTV